MRRRYRDEAPGAIHHVVPKGNNGQPIVVDDHDRRALVDRLRHICETHGWRCHAYCVMDTHLHAVVETAQPNLGRGMKALLGWYAYRFNDRHGREGHLFGGPFWSRRAEKPEHVVAACLYAVVNPVAAGLSPHPSRWAWCSYRATAGLGAASFVHVDALLTALGGSAEQGRLAYRRLVDTCSERARASMREDWRTAIRAIVAQEGPVASG